MKIYNEKAETVGLKDPRYQLNQNKDETQQKIFGCSRNVHFFGIFLMNSLQGRTEKLTGLIQNVTGKHEMSFKLMRRDNKSKLCITYCI